jgi:hypothetical protein
VSNRYSPVLFVVAERPLFGPSRMETVAALRRNPELEVTVPVNVTALGAGGVGDVGVVPDPPDPPHPAAMNRQTEPMVAAADARITAAVTCHLARRP